MTQTFTIEEEHLRALIEKIHELEESGMITSEDRPGHLHMVSDVALVMIFSEGFAHGHTRGEAEERDRWQDVEAAAKRLADAFDRFRDNTVLRMADMGLLPTGKA